MDDVTSPLDPRLLDQLPALPAIAAEFLRLCDDPDASVADAARVASGDPALLARILQTVNSPYYSLRVPVTDAGRAASILGLRSMTLIGVGFAILGDLWGGTEESESLAGIMGASAMAASAARTFSERTRSGDGEAVATSGFLAFVGELALLRAEPETFALLWDRSGRLPSIDNQRAMIGTDGVAVGSVLMDRWGLPEELSDGVRVRQLSLEERLAHSEAGLNVLLGFGTAIAVLLNAGEDVLKTVEEPAIAWGTSGDDLLGFWADFKTAALQTTQQLGLDMGSDIARIIEEAKEAYLTSPVALTGEPAGMESELDTARKEIEDLREENDRLEGLSLQDSLTCAEPPGLYHFLAIQPCPDEPRSRRAPGGGRHVRSRPLQTSERHVGPPCRRSAARRDGIGWAACGSPERAVRSLGRR